MQQRILVHSFCSVEIVIIVYFGWFGGVLNQVLGQEIKRAVEACVGVYVVASGYVCRSIVTCQSKSLSLFEQLLA